MSINYVLRAVIRMLWEEEEEEEEEERKKERKKERKSVNSRNNRILTILSNGLSS